MRSSDYWKGRMAALNEANYRRSAAYYEDVKKQYQKAIRDMERDILVWYERIADNNGISLASAKKLLKRDELEEFRWTVEEYIKAGRENAVSGQWMKQLENASARYHISRLEAMKLQLQQRAETIAAEFGSSLKEFLGSVYEEQGYRTAYEIMAGTGVGRSFERISLRTIEQVLEKPWAQDGKVFSERIWENRDRLVQNLHSILSQGVTRGFSSQRMIAELSHSMEVSRNQAANLILTETAAISARATQDTYQELDVEEFEVLETLDRRTCSLCADMDGRHFPVKDYQIGVTAPPFHPRCRGTTVPYFDDEFTAGEMRAARDENDEGYELVPADMTYREWEARFVREEKTSAKDNTEFSGTDIIELSHEELHALKRYLSSESYTLNDRLRRGEKLSAEEKQWITNLDAALDKMPEYEGTVYRSVSAFGIDDVNAFIDSHVIGRVIKNPSYVSSSDNIYDESFPIQYVIQSKHGKNIQKYNEAEREILFKRNSSFRVVGINGNTIYMEEL